MAIEARKNLEEKLHRQTLSPKMNQSDLDNEPFARMWKEREDTAVFSIRRAQGLRPYRFICREYFLIFPNFHFTVLFYESFRIAIGMKIIINFLS
jgi:hypothetical protein